MKFTIPIPLPREPKALHDKVMSAAAIRFGHHMRSLRGLRASHGVAT